MARQRVARLPGRDHEDRAVRVGQVIDAAIARARHLCPPSRRGQTVRPRRRSAVARAARARRARQREIPARRGLDQAHHPAQTRHPAERGVFVPRLVDVAPAPAGHVAAEPARQVQDRGVQRLPRDGRAAFDRGGLHHVAPDARAARVAEHRVDERGPEARERIRQRPQLVLHQPRLQLRHPRRIDQRLGQVLAHVAVPFGQQRKRVLPLPLGRALRGGLSREPQVRAHQRQQRAGGRADGVELGCDEAVARMNLARG